MDTFSKKQGKLEVASSGSRCASNHATAPASSGRAFDPRHICGADGGKQRDRSRHPMREPEIVVAAPSFFADQLRAGKPGHAFWSALRNFIEAIDDMFETSGGHRARKPF